MNFGEVDAEVMTVAVWASVTDVASLRRGLRGCGGLGCYGGALTNAGDGGIVLADNRIDGGR
jgi:hypothetical protein